MNNSLLVSSNEFQKIPGHSRLAKIGILFLTLVSSVLMIAITTSPTHAAYITYVNNVPVDFGDEKVSPGVTNLIGGRVSSPGVWPGINEIRTFGYNPYYTLYGETSGPGLGWAYLGHQLVTHTAYSSCNWDADADFGPVPLVCEYLL